MDWKVIAALVVAVAIVVSGFLVSGGVNIPGVGSTSETAQNPPEAQSNPIGDFLSSAKDAVSNALIGTMAEKNINRTLQVSGSLAMEDKALKLNTPASSIAIEFSAPASMNVGNQIINFSDVTRVSIGSFIGKLDIHANGTIIIDGNAETIHVSNIGILPHAQKTALLKVTANVKSAKIYNATADRLSFNATGSMGIGQERATLKISSEPVQIENFKGNMDISGSSLILEGLSTKVLLNNREKVSIG